MRDNCGKSLALFAWFAVFLVTIVQGCAENSLPSINDVITQQQMAGKKRILIPSGRYGISGSVLVDNTFTGKEITADGEVVILSSFGGPVFHVTGTEHMTIKGFTLKSVNLGDPSQPIAFYFGVQSSNKNRSEAIKITNSSNIQILSNTISGYWRGIYISTIKDLCHDILVKDNRITDCGYWSIAAHTKSQGRTQKGHLTKMQFSNNYITRCEQGPVFRGVTNSIIDGNEVTGNIIGVRLEESSKNIVKGNKVYNNLKAGIWLYNGSCENCIVSNRIYDNNLQAARIMRIANKYGMDSDYLPGDLKCFERGCKADYQTYKAKIIEKYDMLEFNKDFWPYPTEYAHITPGIRFGPPTHDELKKYWGMYFCQWSGVGIELRNRANKNTLHDNDIYNSSPISFNTGYMIYGIRISQLGLTNAEDYASRENIIENNRILNMVKGSILDDNIFFGIKAGNVYR